MVVEVQRGKSRKRYTLLAAGVISSLIILVDSGYGQTGGTNSAVDGDVQLSPISGPIDSPRRHFRLRHPAKLTPEEANRIYGLISQAMGRGYAESKYSGIDDFHGWKKFNTAPYLSATHGNHYLNNYANDIASDYGRFEDAGILPEGSILAKDSFSVTETREILLGPLYVMIKMAPGFNPLTGDWRYVQIQPDGMLLGETKGEGSERVEYCIACHLARAEFFDHLYYIPSDYR